MSEIKYLKISSSDETKLLEAIEKITIETKAHDQNSNDILNWSWKFKSLPSQLSYIYIAKLNKKIIGYYHIPIFNFIYNKQVIKIGNVQSVAVLKEFRNKGVFEKLSKYANDDIEKHVELLYTFPNDKSIHTFLKYNSYKFIKTLPVYIFPINFVTVLNLKLPSLVSKIFSKMLKILSNLKKYKINRNEIIYNTEILSYENLELFKYYNSRFKYHLLRDKKFLKWKYVDSVKSKYFCISYIKDNNIQASVVLKFDKMFDNNCIIVMDYAYINILSMKKLLSNLEEVDLIRSRKPSFVMLTGLSEDLRAISNCGFFKVPKFLIPRKLNLLIKSCSKNIMPNKLNTEDWYISLSDWDVL